MRAKYRVLPYAGGWIIEQSFLGLWLFSYCGIYGFRDRDSFFRPTMYETADAALTALEGLIFKAGMERYAERSRKRANERHEQSNKPIVVPPWPRKNKHDA